MENNETILSILVISHNQEHLLTRCMESILKQRIDFPYEIIVSDDASTDNTWNIIQKYVSWYPGKVFGYQINSSNINPVNRSERCGYNKANAYKHSKGKYFVNIDADDFLLSDNIYQIQVEMLEKHLECIMCMQNVSFYNEGSPPEYQGLWFPPEKIETGKILNSKEYILGKYSILNQAFVIRRIENTDPARILGKDFDDTLITLFHLQYGKIIYLNRADYAYVVSKSSINSSLVGLDREVVMFELIFYHIFFIPHFAGLFLKAELKSIMQMMRKSIVTSQLKQETKKWLMQFDGFAFRMFLINKMTIDYEIRKKIILIYAKIIDRFDLTNSLFYKILFLLLLGWKSWNKNLNFSLN